MPVEIAQRRQAAQGARAEQVAPVPPHVLLRHHHADHGPDAQPEEQRLGPRSHHPAISRRAAIARPIVTPSAYSRSPPTGNPSAIRVTLTPDTSSVSRRYVAVTSPSMEGLVATITSLTPAPFLSRAFRASMARSSGPMPSSGDRCPPST